MIVIIKIGSHCVVLADLELFVDLIVSASLELILKA